MARYRYRFRRRLRGRNGRFAVSAVAAGLLLAVVAGHHAAAPPGGGRGAGAAPASCASCSPNEALANQMAAAGYGWGGAQATCLDELWTRESAGTWSPAVTNPDSGAYGIPQALPAAKMAAAGPDWQSDPATQIRWGLGYIHGRYGSPCGAWAHETADSWY